uniref:Peptidase_M13 domain-containing protein n=1 Tax=Strongyloides papillosus TaxID=174720 RepID=A0A0N5B2Z7_STREA
MKNCYDNIGINYNDYIANIIKTIKHYKALSDANDDNLNTCRVKIFQHDIFNDLAIYRNAVYFGKSNSFFFTSDYHNEPSFSRNFPMSPNYGNTGYTIGHEILHTFDNGNYDRILEGDSRNKFNITQMLVKNFEEKIKCFVKQYDENIADNGGLKIAHRAFMKYLQSIDNIDLIVPGLGKYTKEQLFFISYGKKRCEYRSKDKLEKQINTSKHAPSEIRTNIALSNYKPFSDAFNCPVNSRMNPEYKCELWKNH